MLDVSLAEAVARGAPGLANTLSEADAHRLLHHWGFWARPAQLPPPGDWREWLILAGRGFGKTRAGAEWVRGLARVDGGARIALIGASLAEARAIMVEGDSGVLAVCPPEERPLWEPSLRRLRWRSGAQAMLYSASEPDSLRGPQHGYAWCDELAKWDNVQGRAEAAWKNLRLGLRLGAAPRALVTTTPRAVPLVRRLAQDRPGRVVTRGRTRDNRLHLSPVFVEAMEESYGGTWFGRQELDGELIEDLPGALWTRGLIERCRTSAQSYRGEPLRVVIGVDPPAGRAGDACGILVAALFADGRARVLADCSVERAGPEQWARAVERAADRWRADRVIAEANQGGAMVETVLRAACVTLPLRLVHASRGKVARAEPVAALYEAGRVLHAGLFPRLEDELCGLVRGGAYAGPGGSPDRADALVWALTELMLVRPAHEPRIHYWEG